MRVWSATEAQALGRGGVSTAAKAAGLSRTAIYAGLKSLESHESPVAQGAGRGRIRAKGGGRKRLSRKNPKLLEDLEALVEPATRRDFV